jgi:UPF0716 protein FxsA
MFGRIVLVSVLALPLIEIALFVVVGQAIGLVPTLLGVLLAAIAGGLIIRWQGIEALREMQVRMQRGEMPARQMGDTMFIVAGGLMLVVPGFFTDVIGLLLLLPWTRELIYRLLARNFRVVEATSTSTRRTDDPGLIDLDRGNWRDGPSV